MPTDSCHVPSPLLGYALLDSGDREKLEQYGDKILVRPSRLCVWKRRLTPSSWEKADARFTHEQGWKWKGARFEEWTLVSNEWSLGLRLQSNGQLGLFPEHYACVEKLRDAIRERKANGTVTVLNLFAYTGMATVASLQEGAQVTHVDLSKKVLDWATQNLTRNKCEREHVRFVKEDALQYLKKERRRNRHYDIIVADPPSFSRISDKQTWELEGVVRELVDDIAAICNDDGALFITSHAYEYGAIVLANLLDDALRESGKAARIDTDELILKERDSNRILPAGFIATAALKKKSE